MRDDRRGAWDERGGRERSDELSSKRVAEGDESDTREGDVSCMVTCTNTDTHTLAARDALLFFPRPLILLHFPIQSQLPPSCPSTNTILLHSDLRFHFYPLSHLIFPSFRCFHIFCFFGFSFFPQIFSMPSLAHIPMAPGPTLIRFSLPFHPPIHPPYIYHWLSDFIFIFSGLFSLYSVIYDIIYFFMIMNTWTHARTHTIIGSSETRIFQLLKGRSKTQWWWKLII